MNPDREELEQELADESDRQDIEADRAAFDREIIDNIRKGI